MSESDLNKTLERLGSLLTTEVEAWEKRTRADRRRVMDRVSTRLNEALDKQSRRQTRREQKAARRAARRQEERENASVAGGVFGLIIAAVLVGFAAFRPEFWWLIFVALGVGGGGARQLGLATARNRLPRGPVVQAPEPIQASSPERHEIDQLCDQLLADLKASPQAVRSFLQDPEKTVEALRATSKSLDSRRQQLEAEDAKGKLAALVTQRQALVTRIEAAVDPQAKAKLQGALGSLDGQAAALHQLTAAAERVDGEYTALLVLLQELKTRVAVARSTTSGVQLDGLQHSVQRLNAELEAITDSLRAAPGEGLALPPVDEGAVSQERGAETDPLRTR
jgi:predicted phage tail protein